MTREIAPAEEPEMTDGAEMFSAQSRGMLTQLWSMMRSQMMLPQIWEGRALKTESSEMTQKL